MNDKLTRSRSQFATTARQRIRTALELAATRSPDSTSRVVAELDALATEAGALELHSLANLARRSKDQATRLDRDYSAVTSCARALRELGRALEMLEQEFHPRPEAATKKEKSNGRVLVVDDSPLNMAVVCDMLERAAFETSQAQDGAAAVAEIARFRPHVVLADVQMPGLTPAELCARIREAAGGRTLRVLLFSALPEAELSEVARVAGADGFISKVRGLEAVVEEVTKVCQENPA